MPESFFFPIYSGLLTEEHRNKIGPALWEFLWCISATTSEVEQDGSLSGVVLGGKPVSYNDVAKELGGSKSTVKRNFEKLEEQGYIEMKRTPYGHIIHVKNSKKFKKSAKNSTGAKYGTGAENGQRSAIFGMGGAENGHSNKYIKRDIKDIKNNNDVGGGAPATEIVQLADKRQSKGQIPQPSYEQCLIDKYMQLAALPGFDIPEYQKMAVRQVINSGVSLDDALKYLEECFQEYTPKHVRDKINSFNYCATVILNKYHQKLDSENLKNKPPVRKGRYGKPIRQELLPNWFDDVSQSAKQPKKQDSPVDIDAKKREIEEMLKAFDG